MRNLLEVNLNWRSDRKLYRARLRSRSRGLKSFVVYRVGSFSVNVHDQLKKEYGDNFFVSEVTLMKPEQIIRAANKHLPEIIEMQLNSRT